VSRWESGETVVLRYFRGGPLARRRCSDPRPSRARTLDLALLGRPRLRGLVHKSRGTLTNKRCGMGYRPTANSTYGSTVTALGDGRTSGNLMSSSNRAISVPSRRRRSVPKESALSPNGRSRLDGRSGGRRGQGRVSRSPRAGTPRDGTSTVDRGTLRAIRRLRDLPAPTFALLQPDKDVEGDLHGQPGRIEVSG
jgi:hypothetical protein